MQTYRLIGKPAQARGASARTVAVKSPVLVGVIAFRLALLLSCDGRHRQIRLHLRNCGLEPAPQRFLHLGVPAIALQAFERIAAIVQGYVVTWYGCAPPVSRNKVHQETFRAGVSSGDRSIVQARGRVPKDRKFFARLSYRPLITAMFQKAKLKLECVQQLLLIHRPLGLPVLRTLF